MFAFRSSVRLGHNVCAQFATRRLKEPSEPSQKGFLGFPNTAKVLRHDDGPRGLMIAKQTGSGIPHPETLRTRNPKP